MLSSAKIGTASWRYYQREVATDPSEYFLAHGEAPGRWWGRGLPELGLGPNAVVLERQLESLLARGLHPETGRQLGRAWRTDGVTGYDLTFSAPKSVSALWAISGPHIAGEIADAHKAAVRAALTFLDSHAAMSRKGVDGVTPIRTAGFAAAIFDHRTSRAGDPQLHSHALVVNKLRCADGGWRTIDGHEIYHHKKAAGALYQAALRAELTRRLGVAFDPVNPHGQAEIAGVPAELITTWSKRARQVDADAAPTLAGFADELGRDLTPAERARVVKTSVLKTRPRKAHLEPGVLQNRWRSEAAMAGWSPDRLTRAVLDAGRRHR
ncbi:MAG: relaxase domain-containing protein, partial [Cryobacterium sp.]|uniref:MobF family relaxase n=1 Tax=Cryobacterium sp. TaxID=1926290 RepID=UPI002295C954